MPVFSTPAYAIQATVCFIKTIETTFDSTYYECSSGTILEVLFGDSGGIFYKLNVNTEADENDQPVGNEPRIIPENYIVEDEAEMITRLNEIFGGG